MLRRSRRSFFTAVTASVLASLALIACGSDDSSAPKDQSRPLTVEEAGTLAQVLYSNYEAGGADFVVTSLTEPRGQQVQLQGIVDWKNHSGHAVIRASLPDTQLSDVYWLTNMAAERRPTFDQILMGQGAAPEPVLVRSPNMNLRLDQMLAVVTGLASQQPENAQLILQNPNTEFIRDDTLQGTEVMVVRYGQRSLYWIAKDSGRLVRFEGNNERGDLPIVVDLPAVGSRTIDFPTEDRFISQSELGEMSSILTTW